MRLNTSWAADYRDEENKHNAGIKIDNKSEKQQWMSPRSRVSSEAASVVSLWCFHTDNLGIRKQTTSKIILKRELAVWGHSCFKHIIKKQQASGCFFWGYLTKMLSPRDLYKLSTQSCDLQRDKIPNFAGESGHFGKIHKVLGLLQHSK